MYNVKFCKNCSKNKNSLMADISSQYEEYYAGFTVCFNQAAINNDTKCPMCGQEGLIDSGITENDLNDIGIASSYNRQLLEEMIKIHNENIIDYELKMSQFRTQALQAKQIQESENNKQKCPRCGNTTFTPMKKKWSMLTGFATNQVELVCNNCGYKMKAK